MSLQLASTVLLLTMRHSCANHRRGLSQGYADPFGSQPWQQQADWDVVLLCVLVAAERSGSAEPRGLPCSTTTSVPLGRGGRRNQLRLTPYRHDFLMRKPLDRHTKQLLREGRRGDIIGSCKAEGEWPAVTSTNVTQRRTDDHCGDLEGREAPQHSTHRVARALHTAEGATCLRRGGHGRMETRASASGWSKSMCGRCDGTTYQMKAGAFIMDSDAHWTERLPFEKAPGCSPVKCFAPLPLPNE